MCSVHSDVSVGEDVEPSFRATPWGDLSVLIPML